MRKFHSK